MIWWGPIAGSKMAVLGWGRTMSRFFHMGVFGLRCCKFRSQCSDLAWEIRDCIRQQSYQGSVGLCCYCKIYQRQGVVLLHLGENRCIGLCSVHICCISLGLWCPWWSLGFLECLSKVILEVVPYFLEARFLGPLSTIILIQPAFFDVWLRHRDNLSMCIHICTATAYLFHSIFYKLFREGFAWNMILHFPINLLHVLIFKFYLLSDEVS